MTKSNILPRLRHDLKYQSVKDETDEFLILIDPHRYAAQPISIPAPLMQLFSIIDGEVTQEEFENKVKEIYGDQSAMVLDPFMQLLQYMDYAGFLESEKFLQIKADMDNYLAAPLRPSICAGSSFAAEPNILKNELDELFASVNPEEVEAGANGIIVPHIDFRIGDGAHRAYASGYHALRGSKLSLAVIFGTSHYGQSGHFMFTRKDFDTPYGPVKTDTELLDKLQESLSFEMVYDELAHRPEHSIELQAVLLRHYFPDNKLKILPVLVGSFHDYISEGKLPSDDSKFTEFSQKLREIIENEGREAVYIASADFAHIGRKFQDDFDAEPMLEVLKAEDGILLDSLKKCDYDSFFSTVSDVRDKNKICGLSPIYSLLHTLQPEKGKLYEYSQWNETETKSAVSFAGIAYY